MTTTRPNPAPVTQKMRECGTIGLEEVVQPRRDKAIPSEYPHLQYIGLEHVEAHTTKLLGSVPAAQLRSTANRFYSGDVLYGRLRPYLNKVWRADREGLCSSEFIVLPGNARVDPDFLRYRLNAQDFVSFASHLNAGDRPRVDFDQISVFKTWIPKSLDEQRRIVSEIEKQFTRLETGVAALQSIRAKLKRYRAAVLKAACEGRLVPTEAELARKENRSYEPAEILLQRILKERREKWNGKGKYQEPLSPNSVDLPFLPEGWTWCMSDAVFVFVTSGSRGWAKYYSEEGPIFLRIGNLNHEDIRLDLTNLQHVAPPRGAEGTRTAVKPNDILVSITADVGMVALMPSQLGETYINQHVALARPISSVCPEYIAYYLSSSEGGWSQLKKLQRGATKVGLGLDDIRAVPIPLPPLAEQKRIVAELEWRLSVLEELDILMTTNLQRATRLRQSVLSQAFTDGLCKTKE